LYRKTTLGNGVRILTETLPHFYSVSAGIWCDIGSRDERSDEERGITHFIEHMFFKGTRRRNALDIAKEFDAIGGYANAFTSKEQLCLHARVLDRHLPKVVEILQDLFLNSVFEPDEIERERQVILQEINMIEDTPDDYVHILFQDLFWRSHPLGHPVYGAEGSVSRIRREQIVRYLPRALGSESVVVAAAGNLGHQAFVDLVAPTFEGLVPAEPALPRTVPSSRAMVEAYNRELEQVHICLGGEACSLKDERRFAYNMLNVVLGGGMSSRLFQEVREKRGLAYAVYSFVSSYEDAGMFGVYAGVGPDRVEETLEVVREELARLAREPVSEEELFGAREYLKGSLYLGMENTDSRMTRLAKNELLFHRQIPFEEMERRLDEVTAEDMRKLMADLLERPDGLAAVLLGPVDSGKAPGSFRSVMRW